MNPSYAYCALIDVLGYRSRLKGDQESGSFAFKDDLEEALRCFDGVNSAVFGVHAISDTVILTCTTHANFIEFLQVIKSVFLAFLKRGLFVRGGIAYSKHFQNNKLTYSHAIARSYELESSRAIHPRIVIDENIIQMHSGPGSTVQLRKADLVAQQNGVYFLHVLADPQWPAIYMSAKAAYERDKNGLIANEAALGKHVWFEEYLRTFVPTESKFEAYIERASLY
ncbi:hypothetical protein [Dyella silvae]|uniref:hypothetical protein n=1 Tax=Dyella silvae TaxID=2994424 RepID=UPI0022649896|nr:hypothetical protein [Dyella silvae]